MKLLDVIALLEDRPQLRLYRGQVGTIVEEYEPGVFEVESARHKWSRLRICNTTSSAVDGFTSPTSRSRNIISKVIQLPYLSKAMVGCLGDFS